MAIYDASRAASEACALETRDWFSDTLHREEMKLVRLDTILVELVVSLGRAGSEWR